MRFILPLAALARRVVVSLKISSADDISAPAIGRGRTTNSASDKLSVAARARVSRQPGDSTPAAEAACRQLGDNHASTRRDLLRRAPIAAMAIAAPAVALAEPSTRLPKVAEDPRLIALGAKLDQAGAEYMAAGAYLERALALASDLRPPVPEALTYYQEGFGRWYIPEIDSAPAGAVGHFFSADMLRRYIDQKGLTRRTKAGRLMIDRLAIAEAHEEACESAREAAGVGDAEERASRAEYALEQLAREAAGIGALTFEGLKVKARALFAWAATSEHHALLSQRLLGASIADDLLKLPIAA